VSAAARDRKARVALALKKLAGRGIILVASLLLLLSLRLRHLSLSLPLRWRWFWTIHLIFSSHLPGLCGVNARVNARFQCFIVSKLPARGFLVDSGWARSTVGGNAPHGRDKPLLLRYLVFWIKRC